MDLSPVGHIATAASADTYAIPRSCPQDIAAGALPRASSLVVVTDANVWRCHGDRFRAAFTTAGVAPAPLVHVLQPGEASKVRESKAVIEDWMLANE